MSNVATILDKKGSVVASVYETDTVLYAAQIMRERRIGSVVVLRGSTVVGIFTERDVLNRVVAESKNPENLHMADVMTAAVATCTPMTTLKECASLMSRRRMRHIPVINDGELAGIVTSGDIMAYKLSHLEETNILLKEYISGPQELQEATI